jgi:amiloride-sensitive sodium channel
MVIKLSENQYLIKDIAFPAVTLCPDVVIPEEFTNSSGKLDEGSVPSRNWFRELVLYRFRFYIYNLLELLYEQKFPTSINHKRTIDDFFATLSKQTQDTWFWNEVNAVWRARYAAPISKVLTKWGFCFNFNLLPADELLNSEVSNDFFHVTEDVNCSSNVLNESMPYKMPSLDIALSINVRFRKFFNYKYNYNNSLQPLAMMRVIAHSPYELTSYMGQEFIHTSIEISSVVVEPEIQMIDGSLHSLSPHTRNCFLSSEKTLKYFKVYTRRNCEQECLSAMIYSRCKCVPFYVIRETDEEI